jgi:hypothetical protein
VPVAVVPIVAVAVFVVLVVRIPRGLAVDDASAAGRCSFGQSPVDSLTYRVMPVILEAVAPLA